MSKSSNQAIHAMKISFVAICLLIQFCGHAQDSLQARLSAAQRITSRYITLLSLSVNEQAALKKAVQSLEDKGLYYKLLSFNIGRFTQQGKCYNLLAPFTDDGSLTLTFDAGTPEKLSSGIKLSSTDILDTHFVNDLASDAPYIGVFCYTDTNVTKPFINSASPFKINPYEGGKVYVSIWGAASGIAVPPTPFVFSLGQRTDDDHVEFFHDDTKYSETLPIDTQNPTGNHIYITGNSSGDLILKVFGFTKSLTQQQASDLKQIIGQLMADLGI